MIIDGVWCPRYNDENQVGIARRRKKMWYLLVIKRNHEGYSVWCGPEGAYRRHTHDIVVTRSKNYERLRKFADESLFRKTVDGVCGSLQTLANMAVAFEQLDEGRYKAANGHG